MLAGSRVDLGVDARPGPPAPRRRPSRASASSRAPRSVSSSSCDCSSSSASSVSSSASRSGGERVELVHQRLGLARRDHGLQLRLQPRRGASSARRRRARRARRPLTARRGARRRRGEARRLRRSSAAARVGGGALRQRASTVAELVERACRAAAAPAGRRSARRRWTRPDPGVDTARSVDGCVGGIERCVERRMVVAGCRPGAYTRARPAPVWHRCAARRRRPAVVGVGRRPGVGRGEPGRARAGGAVGGTGRAARVAGDLARGTRCPAGTGAPAAGRRRAAPPSPRAGRTGVAGVHVRLPDLRRVQAALHLLTALVVELGDVAASACSRWGRRPTPPSSAAA